jgi:hypothetical protein
MPNARAAHGEQSYNTAPVWGAVDQLPASRAFMTWSVRSALRLA